MNTPTTTPAVQPTNGKATQPMTADEVTHIPLDLIDPSPYQKRRIFRDLEGLAKSIVKVGQLEPIGVRPMGKRFELVFGERRWRALKEHSSLQMIWAGVKKMSDDEAREKVLIENGQRDDLHPMEQAEAYESMRKDLKYSVDTIAEKVNKSKATVYASLKLCALGPDARKAFLSDPGFTQSHALQVARIPSHALQKKAMSDIGPSQHSPDWEGVRRSAEIIQRKYTLKILDAPFDLKDAKLCPKAGACEGCPKRSGNQKELYELYPDLKGADVCMDPECYSEKQDAHWKIASLQAKKDKRDVLSTTDAKNVWPWDSSAMNGGAGYIDLAAKCPDDPKGRTWAAILKKAELSPTLARRPFDGAVIELVRDKEARAAARAVLKLTRPEPSAREKNATKKQKAAQEKERQREALEARMNVFAVEAIVHGVEKRAPNKAFWHALAAATAYQNMGGAADALERRGLHEGFVGDKTLDGILAKMPDATARGFAIECLLTTYGDTVKGTFGAFCKLFGVKPQSFKKKASAAMKAEKLRAGAPEKDAKAEARAAKAAK